MKRGDFWDRLPPKSMTGAGRKLIAAILAVTLLTIVFGLLGGGRREITAYYSPASDRMVFYSDVRLLNQTAPGSYVASDTAVQGGCVVVLTRQGRADTLWSATNTGVREIFSGRTTVFTVSDDGSSVCWLSGDRQLCRAATGGGAYQELAAGVADYVISPDGRTIVYTAGGKLCWVKGGRTGELGSGFVPVSVSDGGDVYATDGQNCLYYMTLKTDPVRLTSNLTGGGFFVNSDRSEILYGDGGDAVVSRGSAFVARLIYKDVFPAGERRAVKSTTANVYECDRETFSSGYFLTAVISDTIRFSPGRLLWLDAGGLTHPVTADGTVLAQQPVLTGADSCVCVCGDGSLLRVTQASAETIGENAASCAVTENGAAVYYLDRGGNLHAVTRQGDAALAGSMRQLAVYRNRYYCVDTSGRLYTGKGSRQPALLMSDIASVRALRRSVVCFGLPDGNDAAGLFVSRSGGRFAEQRDRIVP